MMDSKKKLNYYSDSDIRGSYEKIKTQNMNKITAYVRIAAIFNINLLFLYKDI